MFWWSPSPARSATGVSVRCAAVTSVADVRAVHRLGPSHVSNHHVAKHRSTPEHTLRSRLRPRLRGLALLSGVAVGATGLAVSAGVLAGSSPVDSAASASEQVAAPVQRLSSADLAERQARVSRSDERRPVADRAKTRALAAGAGRAATHTRDLSTADPRTLAKSLMPQFGMSASQFSCLDSLWVGESGWDVHADNPSSSAYGIPQALPGSKMASAGPDWANNPVTQIKWGLGYVKARYGSPCAAESFKLGHGWY